MQNNPDFLDYVDKHVTEGKPQASEGYIPDYSDPARQREDAVIESIALLRIVSMQKSALIKTYPLSYGSIKRQSFPIN